MTSRLRRVPILPLVTVVLLLGTVALMPDARAQRLVRFTEAALFFELNDTDGDLGFHASIDGEPWTGLAIENLLEISADRELRNQGLTQLSFESAEPSFDDLAPPDFFRGSPRVAIASRAGRSKEAGWRARRFCRTFSRRVPRIS